MMLIQILLLFLAQLLVPIYLIYSIWNAHDKSRFEWLLKVLYSGTYLLYIFLAGRWDWMSYYSRYVFPVFYIAAVIVSYRRVEALPFFVETGSDLWRKNGSALLTLLVFVIFLAWSIRGYFYTGTPVHLTFPLQGGWYYVGQGGNSTRVNYHNSRNAQRYALDVLALNAAGIRALGIYPASLDRYVIFGETIHSPCDGKVAMAVDGLQDQIPPAADREHLAGNHVVIDCQGVFVLLAHMQKNSVIVEEGDNVITGQPLGRVGNSGNTSEPHLHIHAVRTDTGDVLEGDGVPMLFDGIFPVRNTTF